MFLPDSLDVLDALDQEIEGATDVAVVRDALRALIGHLRAQVEYQNSAGDMCPD